MFTRACWGFCPLQQYTAYLIQCVFHFVQFTAYFVQCVVQDILKSDKDYRVRTNAIRALQGYSFEKSKPLFLSALNDENVNVAIAATEVIKSNVTSQSADWIKSVTPKMNWRVRTNLYEAALSFDSNNARIEEVKKSYRISTNEYE